MGFVTIASTTNLNGPSGTTQEVLVQFIGEKLSRLDYISGTVKLKASFLQLSKEEKEQAILDVIKKEFYPEPFNQDRIEEVSKTVDLVKGELTTKVEELKFEQDNLQAKQSELEANESTAIERYKELNDSVKSISKHILKSDIAQEDYDNIISVFPEWKVETSYSVGDIVRYQGKAWEVIQAHTSESDWTPDTVPALFKEVTPKKVVDETTGEETEIIPDFVQPTGTHDVYSKGDKVLFQDKVYTSAIDNNAYSPSDYPQGWEEMK